MENTDERVLGVLSASGPTDLHRLQRSLSIAAVEMLFTPATIASRLERLAHSSLGSEARTGEYNLGAIGRAFLEGEIEAGHIEAAGTRTDQFDRTGSIE